LICSGVTYRGRGYELTSFDRVETSSAMKAALETREWDVVLCDYSMPQFNALQALNLLKEMELDIPFIIISATVGEAVAVEAMRAGAHDYLMKDNLARLGPTIERELHEADNRRARRRAEASLKASETELRALFEAMTDVILVLDAEGRYLKIAPTDPAYLYKPTDDLIGKKLDEVFPNEETDFFLDHIRRALDEGQMHRVEYRLRINEKQMWFDGSVSPMSKDSVLWIARDITDRKHAEQVKAQLTAQVEEQRMRLNNIIANVPGVVWETRGNPDNGTQRIDFISDYIGTMLGYDRDEWLAGQYFWRSIIHPDDRDRAAHEVAARFATGKGSSTLEFRWVAKDGHEVCVESHFAVVTDNEGRPVGLRGVTTDISERKQAERALRESEERYKGLIESSFDGVVIHRNRIIRSANRAYEEMFGYEIGELIGLSVLAIVPADHREFVREGVAREDSLFETIGLKKDGTHINIEVSATACLYQGERARLAAVRDITERKQAQERLQQSERRFRQLAENINEVFWIMDPNKNELLYVSPAFEEIWGQPCESLYKRPDSYLQTIHPEDQESIRAARDRRRQGAHTDDEYRIVRPDGSIRWIHDRAFPIREEGGSVSRIVGIAENITERKRAQDALRESEERYRLLFERNPQPMWVFDLETLAFLEVNDAAIHHYGYSREEFLRMTIKEIHSEEDLPALIQTISGLTPQHKEGGTWKHRKKDGTSIDVEINSHELTFYDRPAQIVLAYDVTERSFLEEQLRQSQKMEAIGQLAGGIAHDFNNLLTAITGYSELSMRRLRAEDPLLSNLHEIKKAGDRAASLTRQLLAFSRKQVLQPKVLDLNSVVSDLEKMLRRLIGEDIELCTVLEPKVGSIKVDPGQIEQIIMNLAVNARDAMPLGGKLIIETKNILLDDEYARKHIAVTPGPFVMLAVSDSGAGIDPKTQSHIFEPFLTTKEVGKGTGLGLSTVYGIVRQSGGNIWVYSEVGLGTTFKIYLPRTDERLQAYKRDSGPEEFLRGTETVLLTEDEEIVRKLACQVLRIYGYQVLDAANGDAALLICESHPAPIHLLITDVIMPGMSGRELATRLTELRPEMKVLYMSGYTDSAIVHHGVLDEGANFIQKPFSTDVLAIRVREVLDARAKAEI
jgi:PAS domain S-box-containing protein